MRRTAEGRASPASVRRVPFNQICAALRNAGVNEQQEIVVDRNATVRQLKRKIGELYGVDKLTIAKVCASIALLLEGNAARYAR